MKTENFCEQFENSCAIRKVGTIVPRFELSTGLDFGNKVFSFSSRVDAQIAENLVATVLDVVDAQLAVYDEHAERLRAALDFALDACRECEPLRKFLAPEIEIAQSASKKEKMKEVCA